MKTSLLSCITSARRLALLMLIGFAAQLVAGQATTPDIVWTMPSPFVYGTSIPTAVAKHPTTGAVIAGTYNYSPAQSTILHVTGSPVRLRVTFQPTDTVTYRKSTRDTEFITVTRAPLTVSASGSKVYGAVVTAPTVTYSGFKFSDSASVLTGAPTIVNPVVAGSNAGNHVLVVGVGTLVAADYLITAANGTYVVSPAPLSVTANGASRAYGAANPAFTGTLTGVVNGDAITATYASSANATTAVGVYPVASTQAITPTLVDPGSRLGNYTVTSTKAALTITQAAQSITGFGALAARTYGNAPYTIGGVTGVAAA